MHRAHALRDLIEAGTLVIRAILAEAGDAAINQAWINLVQALVIDAEPCLHIGTKNFDNDIGLLHQAAEYCDPSGILGERHRPFVTVLILKVGAKPRVARLFAASFTKKKESFEAHKLRNQPNRVMTHARTVNYFDPGAIDLATFPTRFQWLWLA